MKKLLIIYSCLITVSFLAFCTSSIIKRGDSADRDLALKECIEAVQGKCGSVITYASMLEKENARLNRALKAARSKQKLDINSKP